MQLKDYKNKKLTVVNLTNQTVHIGDLRIALPPNGKPGYAINLLAYDSILKKTMRSIEDITNSVHLEELIVQGKIQLWNENGPIVSVADQIKETESPTKHDIKKDIQVETPTILAQVPAAPTTEDIISQLPPSISVTIGNEDAQIYEIDINQTITSAGDKSLNLNVVGSADSNFSLVSGNQVKVLSSGKYVFGYNNVFSSNVMDC
jgi:hypothetical protein